MKTTRIAFLLIAFALIVASTPAQCLLAGMTFTPYGAGCTGLPTPFATPPTLSGAYDPTSCQLSLTLGSNFTCCNQYLVERVIIVGSAPVSNPVPGLPAGCLQLAQADILLSFSNTGSNTIGIQVPPLLPPGLTVFLQGANRYFTTIGFTNDFELSNGLQVTTF